MKEKIEKIVLKKVKENASRLGLELDSITNETEILKSGIIDSLEFVGILQEIEDKTSISINNFIEDENDFKISVNWFLNKVNRNFK